MTDTGSAEAVSGALQLRAVLEEHQQSQQSNFNALAETLGSTLIHFGTNIINAINNLGNKRNLSENPDGKRQELKRPRSEEPSGIRPKDTSDEENLDSDSDGVVSFKRKKKSERVEDDEDDPDI